MASKLLSSVTGGGIFRAESFVFDQAIASGQTGDLVTIGTTGKISKLTYLSNSVSSGAGQSGISIVVDGVSVITEQVLSDLDAATSSEFVIMNGNASGNANGSIGNILDIVGEFIVINKNAGNTTFELKYSYVTGVIK